MADEESKEQEPAKKKGSSLILILLLLLIVLGGGAAAYLLVFSKGGSHAAPTEAEQQQQVAHTPAPGVSAETGPTVTYPAFLVNLADPGGNRYLKITISLELSKEEGFGAEIAAKEARIKDIVISVLSSKTFEEVNTMQGKVALKQEVLRRLNTIMAKGRVTDVYITEFVVQ